MPPSSHPFFFSNLTLYKDPAVKTVFGAAHYVRFHEIIPDHRNSLVKDLSILTLLRNSFTNLVKIVHIEQFNSFKSQLQ